MQARPLIDCSAPTSACTASNGLTPGVEFHLGYGDWIRLLRANGFEVIDLIEVQAPEGARSSQDLVDAEWAHRYPAEEIWRARKRSQVLLREGHIAP
jgi:hypothetical protein